MARKKTATVSQETAKQPQKQIVYIGPSLPAGQLSSYTVFRGQLPAHVQSLIEKCKALKFLFVDVQSLANAQKELSDRSSIVAAKYNEARNFFIKGAN